MPNTFQYTPSFDHFTKLATDYNLIPVYREIPADLETPVSAYLKVQRGPYGFLLESVEGGTNVARYSFIGTEPADVLKTGLGTQLGEVDPMDALASALKPVKHAKIDGLPSFDGGAVGYMAYDTIRYFEPRVPAISDEATGIGVPEAIFLITDSILIFDHVRGSIFVVAHARIDDDSTSHSSYHAATQRIESLVDRIAKPLPQSAFRTAQSPARPSSHTSQHNIDYTHIGSAATAPPQASPETTNQPYIPNMAKGYYFNMIDECKQAIYDGEVIQVVASQRLSRRTPAQPFDLYRSLRSINPSPYMFYLDLDGFQIVGASPELMIQVIDGKVAVHPIAGSRPRGNTPEQDIALEKELLADEKDVAEHVMLLDLGRNDVGRIAKPGTVKVTQQLEIERYSHIMHIVSHVEGDLDDQHDMYDVLRAGFPAGTVSGAPKIRAMELIAEHEPDKRGPYSGAIGYWAYSGNMDTAIALRIMTLRDGVAYLQAGGGIVADSDPQAEYEETLHKMGALMHAIDHTENQLDATLRN